MGSGGRTTPGIAVEPRAEGRKRRLVNPLPRSRRRRVECGRLPTSREQGGQSKAKPPTCRDPMSSWDASSLLLARRVRTAPLKEREGALLDVFLCESPAKSFSRAIDEARIKEIP